MMQFPYTYTGGHLPSTKPISEKVPSRVSEDLNSVHEQLNRLYLITNAIWELLQEKFNLSEDELKQLILKIDSRDGKIDNKVASQPEPCPSCQRPTLLKNKICIYCGTRLESKHVF